MRNSSMPSGMWGTPAPKDPVGSYQYAVHKKHKNDVTPCKCAIAAALYIAIGT